MLIIKVECSITMLSNSLTLNLKIIDKGSTEKLKSNRSKAKKFMSGH